MNKNKADAAAAYLANARKIIAEHGHMVQMVGGGDDFVAWAYTVGLSAKGLPELALTGGNPNTCGSILNDIVSRGQATEAGTINGPGGLTAEAVEVPADDESYPASVACVLYPDARLLQVLWPDANGNLPTSPAYAGPTQPVIGGHA
jgi:hypothetical protein